jgi:hypothetical protein
MLGIANLVCSHHSCIRMLYCLRATWFHPEGCVGISVYGVQLRVKPGCTCVCVCGEGPWYGGTGGRKSNLDSHTFCHEKYTLCFMFVL